MALQFTEDKYSTLTEKEVEAGKEATLLYPANAYIVVESADDNSVLIRMHRDAEQRTEFKNDELTEFDRTEQRKISIPVDFDTMADSTKSVIDNIKTIGYEALKTMEAFSECEDV